MRKSIIWFVIFLSIAGCRLLPAKTITPTLFRTKNPLNTPIDLATSTGVPIQTQTYNPTPTIPSTPMQTPSLLPTFTSSPIIISTATQFQFILQSTSPVYIKSFNHPEKGCDWMGVAGQIFAKDGNPLNNLVVVIKGRLGEKGINSAVLTGLKEAAVYGPGGYEIFLNNEVIGTSKSLIIHLYDLNGKSLSHEFEFDTFADCNKNLIIINFKAIK